MKCNVLSDFLWGSATASYQCEGAWNESGRGLTQWDEFSHNSDKNINNVTGDNAADFFHKFEEDIKLMSKGNQTSFRFSISWTRIIPNGVGKINYEGIQFYNNVINTCLKYNIEPNVTLQHYDLPFSIAKEGGWTNPKIIGAFNNYAKVCFENFGDRVKLWVTQNELRYYAHCSYLQGNYPPNHILDFESYAKTLYYGMVASALAIKTYHDMKLNGMIGIVHACGAVETLHDSEEDKIARFNADLYYIRSILDPALKGYFPQELIDKAKSSNIDISFIDQKYDAILKEGIVDFVGLNVYVRNLVKPYSGEESYMSFNNQGKNSNKLEGSAIKGWFASDDDPSTQKNFWGREMYPKCIYDCIKYVNNKYPNVPLMITENGVASYDQVEDGKINDDERVQYTKEFINWVIKAYDEGLPIYGYYVWSTMDLYSWVNGYEKRYGLVYVDFENNYKRIPKKSWYEYKKWIDTFQRNHLKEK